MSGRVTVIILGGGQGKRLFPLTSYRSKPAVPFGGKYRLVDIPISNSINSGLRRIFVLTQFNSTSLHRHIHRTYPYEYFHQTSVELLAAEQTLANNDWFQGTADAVRKHMQHYHLLDSDTILILSGDHLYRMNYMDILKFHEENEADITISTIPVPKKEVRHFGIMQLRANGHITAFREKPSPEENISSYIMPESLKTTFNVKSKHDVFLASMGIYAFKAKVLMDCLSGREADFGKEVIPKAIDKHKVFGYVFNDYWRDIGTISSFFDASLELTEPHPPFNFFTPNGVIFTRARFLPPNKMFGAELVNALVSEGCNIQDSTIESSVVGVRSVIREGSSLKRVVLMGNDFYEGEKRGRGAHLGIGKNCRIENCILDKNVSIGNNVTITNAAKVEEKDGDNYYIREGLVIIPKGVSIPDGTTI
jgi:glucose-1-phosphate adenylyltransferase